MVLASATLLKSMMLNTRCTYQAHPSVKMAPMTMAIKVLTHTAVPWRLISLTGIKNAQINIYLLKLCPSSLLNKEILNYII